MAIGMNASQPAHRLPFLTALPLRAGGMQVRAADGAALGVMSDAQWAALRGLPPPWDAPAPWPAAIDPRYRADGGGEAELLLLGYGMGGLAAAPATVLARLRDAPVTYTLDRGERAEELRAICREVVELDGYFDRFNLREDAFRAMAAAACTDARARAAPVAWAFYGHPLVGSRPAHLGLALAADQGIAASVYGAGSFIEHCCERFGFEPLDGLRLLRPWMVDRLRDDEHSLFSGFGYDLDPAGRAAQWHDWSRRVCALRGQTQPVRILTAGVGRESLIDMPAVGVPTLSAILQPGSTTAYLPPRAP